MSHAFSTHQTLFPLGPCAHGCYRKKQIHRPEQEDLSRTLLFGTIGSCEFTPEGGFGVSVVRDGLAGGDGGALGPCGGRALSRGVREWGP